MVIVFAFISTISFHIECKRIQKEKDRVFFRVFVYDHYHRTHQETSISINISTTFHILPFVFTAKLKLRLCECMCVFTDTCMSFIFVCVLAHVWLKFVCYTLLFNCYYDYCLFVEFSFRKKRKQIMSWSNLEEKQRSILTPTDSMWDQTPKYVRPKKAFSPRSASFLFTYCAIVVSAIVGLTFDEHFHDSCCILRLLRTSIVLLHIVMINLCVNKFSYILLEEKTSNVCAFMSRASLFICVCVWMYFHFTIYLYLSN